MEKRPMGEWTANEIIPINDEGMEIADVVDRLQKLIDTVKAVGKGLGIQEMGTGVMPQLSQDNPRLIEFTSIHQEMAELEDMFASDTLSSPPITTAEANEKLAELEKRIQKYIQ